ncbi:MAG: adenylate/guanylate cyclase domain-containing protein, partial [Phycisphaeraceae bacterium]|nr:adenylate/guanylate cyclase domain-containing protein [Phycisphaeraceae bacterium]
AADRVALDRLGRYFSPQVAARIRRLPDDGPLESREVTILFCDIRGFTARCQETDAQAIVRMLNHFFAEMVRVVETEHHGLVNKFLGDGFMALFGAGVPRPDHAEAAVRCGLQMARRMEAVNEQVAAIPCPPLEIGVGIHSGQAIVGNIGSDNRLEYTVIGQAVNVASRIESMTKSLNRPLLISDETYQRLHGRLSCEPVGAHPVRGQDGSLHLYAPDLD